MPKSKPISKKTLLHSLVLDEISFCDVPANQEAEVVLFKRADPKLTLDQIAQRITRLERGLARLLKKPKVSPKKKPDMPSRGKPTADLPEQSKKSHVERIAEFDKLLGETRRADQRE